MCAGKGAYAGLYYTKNRREFPNEPHATRSALYTAIADNRPTGPPQHRRPTATSTASSKSQPPKRQPFSKIAGTLSQSDIFPVLTTPYTGSLYRPQNQDSGCMF